MLDALLAAEELPEEYKDRCQVRVSFFITFSLSWWNLQQVCICTKFGGHNYYEFSIKKYFRFWILAQVLPGTCNKHSLLFTLIICRIYFAMTATRREDLVSTGCTTSAASVVRITLGLSRVTLKMIPHLIEVGIVFGFPRVLICTSYSVSGNEWNSLAMVSYL